MGHTQVILGLLAGDVIQFYHEYQAALRKTPPDLQAEHALDVSSREAEDAQEEDALLPQAEGASRACSCREH